MSKITNDGLTWSGTGCFIAFVPNTYMTTVGIKGRTFYSKLINQSIKTHLFSSMCLKRNRDRNS